MSSCSPAAHHSKGCTAHPAAHDSSLHSLSKAMARLYCSVASASKLLLHQHPTGLHTKSVARASPLWQQLPPAVVLCTSQRRVASLKLCQLWKVHMVGQRPPEHMHPWCCRHDRRGFETMTAVRLDGRAVQPYPAAVQLQIVDIRSLPTCMLLVQQLYDQRIGPHVNSCPLAGTF